MVVNKTRQGGFRRPHPTARFGVCFNYIDAPAMLRKQNGCSKAVGSSTDDDRFTIHGFTWPQDPCCDPAAVLDSYTLAALPGNCWMCSTGTVFPLPFATGEASWM